MKNYSPLNDFFNLSFTENDIQLSILEKFRRFLKNSKVKILSSKKVCDEGIILAYFEGTPPFKPKGEIAEKSNDKRFEFPDSISLTTIEKWAQVHKTKVFIISNDEGWHDRCKASKHLVSTDLPKFIEEAQAERDKKYFEKMIKGKIPSLIPEFIKRLEEDIKDSGEFFIDEYEGEVINTKNFQFSNIETSLLELDKKAGLVSIWFSALLKIEVDVQYGDTGTASYDSEDKTLFIHDWIETTWEHEMSAEAEIELFLENDEIEIIEVINQTADAEFRIQNPSWEDYY